MGSLETSSRYALDTGFFEKTLNYFLTGDHQFQSLKQELNLGNLPIWILKKES